MDNQTNQPSKGSSKTGMWALVFLVMVVIAGGIYYFLSQDNTTNTNNANITNTAVNMVANVNENLNENTNTETNTNESNNENINAGTNTNTTVDIGGWETYQNKKYGYSVKYPSNYSVAENITYTDILSGSINGDSLVQSNELKVTITAYQSVSSDLQTWISSFPVNITESSTFDVPEGSAMEVFGNITQEGAAFDVHRVYILQDGTGIVLTETPADSELNDIFLAIARYTQFE